MLTRTALAMLICSVSGAFAQSPTETEGQTHTVQLSARGWVSYRYCASEYCVSLGHPYQYNIRPVSDVNNAALSAISDLGFSFQQNSESPPFRECDALAQKQAGAGFRRFWTDYMVFNNSLLAKTGMTWAQLGVTHKDYITYQVRIVGCYYTKHDGAVVPFTDPKMALEPEHIRQPNLYNTEVTLIMTAHIQQRASHSGFVDIDINLSPKPLLDIIAARMHKALSSVQVEHLSSDRQGNVVY